MDNKNSYIVVCKGTDGLFAIEDATGLYMLFLTEEDAQKMADGINDYVNHTDDCLESETAAIVVEIENQADGDFLAVVIDEDEVIATSYYKTQAEAEAYTDGCYLNNDTDYITGIIDLSI